MNSCLPFALATLGALLTASPAFAQESRERRAQKAERFEKTGPKPGEPAPDFELEIPDGKKVRASKLWTEKPLLLMTGSDTCPVFRRETAPFVRLAEEFRDRVHFLIVYTVEAHPADEPGPYGKGGRATSKARIAKGEPADQPRSFAERAARAAACARRLGLRTPVVVDTMDNATWKAYGSAPNCAYLIGRDGKVLEQQGWFAPQEMRRAIETAIASEPPRR